MSEIWNTAKVREAFIYDGGESDYHDPINGAHDQRRIAGDIFDRWLAAHDAEVRTRAHVNPTGAQVLVAIQAFYHAPGIEDWVDETKDDMRAALRAAGELAHKGAAPVLLDVGEDQ